MFFICYMFSSYIINANIMQIKNKKPTRLNRQLCAQNITQQHQKYTFFSGAWDILQEDHMLDHKTNLYKLKD